MIFANPNRILRRGVPTCPAGRVPTWGDLRWTATIPEGARLRFRAGAASSADEQPALEGMDLDWVCLDAG